MRAKQIFAIALTAGGLIFAPAGSEDAWAADVVPAGQATLDVEVSKGHLIRLPRPAASVFISDPNVADIQVRSPRLVYLMGRKAGQTTLYAVDGADKVMANMDVTVTHNLSGLSSALDTLLPNSNIHLASVNNSVVVKGKVKSAAEAEEVRRLAASYAPEGGEVINRLAVDAPTQVNLRVRVAEVSREIDKELGFNWNLAGSIGGFTFGLSTGNVITSTITNNIVGAAGSGHSVAMGAGVGRWDINSFIDALEQEGLVTIMAEPNLTAMTGETASFLAGGEFPILIPQGSNQVTIEFREFGISLAFTPTILSEDRINLHVRPEVSQLSSAHAVEVTLSSSNTIVVPSLTTRRAETTVELGSGQSFAIAGLLQNNVTHDINKFPGLGDIPMLGAMFKSDRFQRDETELVIIITPYIVQPVSSKNLALPTDGFAPPHDIERLFIGGTWRRNPQKGKSLIVTENGKGLIGPAGFELN